MKRLSINPAVRNVAIIMALAALVVIIPGGTTGATVLTFALTTAFFGAGVYIGTHLYREHRVAIYSLGDSRRAVIYIAAGVAAVVLIGTHKLWSTGVGTIAWIVLLGGCVYASFVVIWAHRQY